MTDTTDTTQAAAPAVIPSTADERIQNTISKIGNVFRHAYRTLEDDEKVLVEKIKDIAGELHATISSFETTTAGREVAIAKTKLEEAVMWAVKAVTK